MAKVTTLRLPENVHQMLKDEAAQNGVTLSEEILSRLVKLARISNLARQQRRRDQVV